MHDLEKKKVSVLAWNCKKQDANPDFLGDLSLLLRNNNIEVVGLIESSNAEDSILTDIKQAGLDFTFKGSDKAGSIKIFVRHSELYSNLKSGIRWVSLDYKNNGQIIKLIFVHLLSKVNTNEVTRHEFVKSFIEDMYENIDTTIPRIIIGDFNSNPFESTVLSTRGLNSIYPSQKILLGKYKVRTGKIYDHHINPSWDLFVNNIDVSGTYYYKDSTIDCLGWNVLDQVVFSESCWKYYVKKSLNVITGISKPADMLDNRGMPDDEKYSDHLPIKFEFCDLP